MAKKRKVSPKAENIREQLRERFEHRNKTEGLKFYGVAKKAGIPQNQVKDLLYGKTYPQIDTTINIADALGFSLEIVEKKDNNELSDIYSKIEELFNKAIKHDHSLIEKEKVYLNLEEILKFYKNIIQ